MGAVSKPKQPHRHAPAGRRCGSPIARIVCGAICLSACAALSSYPIVAHAADAGLSAPALPDLVRTKQRVFSIPFRLPAPQSADAAPQRVILNVSKDLGLTWEQAGEAAPNAGSFTYRAGDDGEYWFQLRAVDAKGRSRGGAGPDIRVLVDAAGPRIAARLWKGSDGEIACRYAAVDDSLRLESLAVEYRAKGDQAWKKISAQGILSRESPAHLVGEEIWWAGEKVEALTVRIAISDSSGNNTVREFSLEPSDPHVDQTALARELGIPPLPTQDSPAPREPHAVAASQPLRVPAGINGMVPASKASGDWAAESAAPWIAESPAAKTADSVLVRKVGTGSPAAMADTTRSRDAWPAAGPTLPASAPTSGGASTPLQFGGEQALEYRGKPLQLLRTRRFAWDYDYQAEANDPGAVRVELWSTRDGGVTWQRAAVDQDAVSPINVSLPAAGLYGFRLEVVPDLPDASGGPQAGDMPDSWVGIDDEPPQAELIEVTPPKPGSQPGVLIRYVTRDQMLVPRSTRLSFSPHADGPWATIGEALENEGEYRWQPTRTAPAKVYIHVEAKDAAGNVGGTTTAAPVMIATARVVGKLGGVRELPASPAP
jgi:hypothetical protein